MPLVARAIPIELNLVDDALYRGECLQPRCGGGRSSRPIDAAPYIHLRAHVHVHAMGDVPEHALTYIRARSPLTTPLQRRARRRFCRTSMRPPCSARSISSASWYVCDHQPASCRPTRHWMGPIRTRRHRTVGRGQRIILRHTIRRRTTC